MYCVWGENGENFLVVICRIVHRLLLREYELFVNIIHAWLIKEFVLIPFLKCWSKAQQRFTGGWGPDPGGIVLLFVFLFFYFCCVIIAFRFMITELFDCCWIEFGFDVYINELQCYSILARIVFIISFILLSFIKRCCSIDLWFIPMNCFIVLAFNMIEVLRLVA